jgi:hypothetical protein
VCGCRSSSRDSQAFRSLSRRPRHSRPVNCSWFDRTQSTSVCRYHTPGMGSSSKDGRVETHPNRRQLEDIVHQTLGSTGKSGRRRKNVNGSIRGIQETVQGVWLVVLGLRWVVGLGRWLSRPLWVGQADLRDVVSCQTVFLGRDGPAGERSMRGDRTAARDCE